MSSLGGIVLQGTSGRLGSDFIVCRCEEVTFGDLQRALQSEDISVRQVKMKTRATMGSCQGHVCRQLIERLMAKERQSRGETYIPDVELLSYRQPLRPVTFGQLAGLTGLAWLVEPSEAEGLATSRNGGDCDDPENP